MPTKKKTPQKRTRKNRPGGSGQTLENALNLKRLREKTNKIRKELGQPSIEEQEAQQKDKGRIKVIYGKAAELNIKRVKEEQKKKMPRKGAK
tara:strand:+ start:364 stop:639 length:276 start_codon:yes stop_codon:yes gene_type:complete